MLDAPDSADIALTSVMGKTCKKSYQQSSMLNNPQEAQMRVLTVLFGLVPALMLSTPLLAQDGGLAIRAKQASYDDVKFELQNAIVSRGLVVDFNGNVGGMLERTGADVGSAKPIYRQAEYFTFCSAKLSRATMEADPANVGFCPYVVFIYATAAQPGTVHVGYRRPQPRGSDAARAALHEVEQLLEAIVTDALK
jgi:uncharacterized protein (DUF302 family)